MTRRNRQRRPLAPSKTAYRLQRLWLTPSFRRFLRIGLPLAACLCASAYWLSDMDHRNVVRREVADLKQVWRTHPIFMVNELRLSGVSTSHETAVLATMGLSFPVSRYDLDTQALKDRLEQIDPIAEAHVTLLADGVLEVVVRERKPVALYRQGDTLTTIDIDGHRIQSAISRRDHENLPLLTGEGAREAVSEAIFLSRIAEPLKDRIRGFVRVGARRWDVVLDRGQAIKLPEENPSQGLTEVLQIISGTDLMERDVVALDIRLPDRPTIKLKNASALYLLAARNGDPE